MIQCCRKNNKRIMKKTFLGVIKDVWMNSWEIVQKARFIKKKAKRKVEKEGEIVYDRHTK